MKTDNELIAEFMGGFNVTPGSSHIGTNIPNFTPLPNEWCDFKDMQFSTSWDWLMPVVKKINKVDIIDMRREQLQETIWRYVSKVQILDAHMYVVEFIKWYNNQKP